MMNKCKELLLRIFDPANCSLLGLSWTRRMERRLPSRMWRNIGKKIDCLRRGRLSQVNTSEHASVCSKHKKVVLNNTKSDFSIIGLFEANMIHALLAKVSRRVPKQIVWTHNHKLVADDSDHEVVYVYDAETTKVVSILQHNKEGLVQTIAVCILRDESDLSLTCSHAGFW